MKAGSLLLLTLLVILRPVSSNSQSLILGQDTSRRVIKVAVPFLLIAPNAANSGLGESGVAIISTEAPIHWNVAGLSFLEDKWGISYSYTPWLGKIINGMSLHYATAHYKISSKHSLGTSLRYFDMGNLYFSGSGNNSINFYEYAIDVDYARLLSANTAFGLAFRYFKTNFAGNFSTSTIEPRISKGFGIDVGLISKQEFQILRRDFVLVFGLNISNFGPWIEYLDESNKDPLPTNLRFGTSISTNVFTWNKVTFSIDLNKILAPTPPVYATDPDTGQLIVDADGNYVISRGKRPDRGLISSTFGSFSDAPYGVKEEIDEISVAGGLEFLIKNKYAIRAGYFYENEEKGNRRYFTLGAGFVSDLFGASFSYLIPQEINHPLSETYRISINLAGS